MIILEQMCMSLERYLKSMSISKRTCYTLASSLTPLQIYQFQKQNATEFTVGNHFFHVLKFTSKR